ncbi:MAG: hypothetical protein JO205_05560 [Pseudolabrys sp.]|nr:hypothetical protein [Pseudolabrys sp.]MBV9260820.1 hypothetical protein [Pseudolabrys sp.]
MAKAKKKHGAKKSKRASRKKMKTASKRKSTKKAEQGFWASFFGAFAGPPSGRGS